VGFKRDHRGRVLRTCIHKSFECACVVLCNLKKKKKTGARSSLQMASFLCLVIVQGAFCKSLAPS